MERSSLARNQSNPLKKTVQILKNIDSFHEIIIFIVFLK